MNDAAFFIGEKKVGAGASTIIVGEIAQAHDGSLGTAHAFIDAISSAGADAVKFQTHIANAESSPREQFRVKFSLQDKTRYDYWKRMEFSEQQWHGLAQHARERGLIFLSSPFSEEAVDLLFRVGVPAWKIASGEVSNPLLMEHILNTGLPILLSTGMSGLDEIDAAVEQIIASGLPFLILQCTSKYPSLPEDIGLNMMPLFRERYRVPVGISDHSGKIYPGLAAVTIGAAMVEVHVTLSREMFGPDVPASLTTEELRQLVEGVRFIEQALAHPVDKDHVGQQMEPMRLLFGKSLVAKRDLKAGTWLAAEDLTARKPGDGIPSNKITTILGKTLKHDVHQGKFLAEDDFE
jgi:N,N'-diacetyllegionaminate synthase